MQSGDVRPAAECAYQVSLDAIQLLRSALDTTASGCQRRGRHKHQAQIQALKVALKRMPHVSISLSDLASVLSLERTYCCKVFKEIAGETFSRWIRRIRIEKASDLLRLERYSITEISEAVGYEDVTTFSRNFRKHFGVSPSQFRKTNAGPRSVPAQSLMECPARTKARS